ncbi:MAG: UDP-N-acetylmuramoyl-tripeptide--D-alanyl-D-alanine ligase [Lachnospiraceae bacterium]|nr:UDP-N-acetylmuramoyl-tripeptide--D-alanyl-D-alanine ligase [Lachnospiraceae bacterium]
MRNMTIEAIAEAVGGRIENGARSDMTKEATSVVIDSRQIEEGGIFVATKGERVDGHSFIDQVFEEGALAVICEKEPDKPKGCCIVVEDSFAALRKLAEYYRRQVSIKVVGIVGSVGKTSTKEIVASVLSAHYEVARTKGNFNNEVGVPLTIFDIRDGHEVAVIEMGISDFGEMERLGQIVRPDIVIYTNIGPCHLEYLHDLDGVFRAKTELIPYISPTGTIVINGQDEKLAGIDEKLAGGRKVIRYGKESKRDDVYASNIENLGLDGSKFTANFPDGSHYDMTVPLPGYHMVDNAIAAAAVGFLMGLNLEEIRRGMSGAEQLSGRGHIIHGERYTIVDDCYNANPKSMCAAIDTLGYAVTRKVAILGDMFELGEESDKLHGDVGDYAASGPVDSLIFVGSAAKFMYEHARLHEDVEIRYYPNKELLIKALSDGPGNILQDGDTILVKASHGMGFSEIVEFLNK